MAVNEIRYKGISYAADDKIRTPSGVLYEAKALRSDSLEANSLTVTVYSDDKSIMGFRKNDKLEYFRDGRRVGVYYLQTVERVGAAAYTLSALSALGRLITMRHAGGIYTGQTVAEVVPQICGTVPVMIESVYAGRQLYGYLPYSNPDKTNGNGRSARDNLSQVLFAIGASLGTDENGVMRVEKLWDGVSCAVTADQISEQDCATVYESPVSAVEITEHQWVQNQEEVTLFEGTAEDGAIVVFDDPAHSLTAEGFTITEQGDNYAVLSAGSGTLTGKGYTHLTRIVRRTVTEGAEENVVAITDATLVSLTNSVDVATRMADYYSHRETVQVDVEPGAEHAGSVVQIYHPWDKKMVQACVESRETVISAILKSKTSALVGFTPQQPDTSEYFSQRIEILQDQEIVLPEGFINGRIVIGSGGNGGNAGTDGESGTSGGSASVSSGRTGKSVGSRGRGGAGGTGGERGLGGKIFAADLDAQAGDVLSIQIGLGGAGGKSSGELGSPGNPTTITLNGELLCSSDSGSVSDAGYTDVTTGVAYGVPGQSGTSGADGGDAQTENDESGEDGGSVGDNKGGTGGYESTRSTTDSDTVYAGYKTSEGAIYHKSGQNLFFTGYTSVSIGSNGDIIGHGSARIGYSSATGTVTTGTVFQNITNRPSLTQVNDYEKVVVTGVGSSPSTVVYTEQEITIVKQTQEKTATTVYGNLGNGGGGAAKGTDAVGKAGANAGNPAEAATPGSGGSGGHGGGGGGGGGAGYINTTGDTGVSKGYSCRGNSGGAGGSASPGSDGANGFAILYYGEILKNSSGPLVTSDGKWLLDSLGRRIIV